MLARALGYPLVPRISPRPAARPSYSCSSPVLLAALRGQVAVISKTWHIAVIAPAGPGVRRSDSRGSAIRKILRPSPIQRDGWKLRPFSGANPGSQLVAVVTEAPGSGVADVRACRVKGDELKRVTEGSRFWCFGVLWLACW